jgi:hypothetical protein
LWTNPYDPAISHTVPVQGADLSVVERVRPGLLATSARLETVDEPEFWVLLRIGACHHGLRAADDPDARPMGDADTAALALLEIQLPQ